MHLFLFIYSVSLSRTCWYFVKLPMSHCMLALSYSPTLLVSLTHTHTYTYTYWVVLFEQLCSALCMFISAIVMVLLLSVFSFISSPCTFSNVTMGNYRRIQLATVNSVVVVVALKTDVMRGAFTFSDCCRVFMTWLKLQFNPLLRK